MPLTDINVLEDSWQSDPDVPVLIVTARLAQQALEEGELEGLIRDCLGAQYLSGKKIVYVDIDFNA